MACVWLVWLVRGTRRASLRRVVSFSHEMLVDLCRQQAELARALLLVLGIEAEGARAEQGAIDLSQAAPAEYRADAVVVFRDEAGEARGAAIIEVQLNPDPDKRQTWPLYVAALRAELSCPVYLVVLTPDPKVARWARAPIALGHPGFTLTPLVLELAAVPRVTEVAAARRLPELAVLSVMGHPDLEVAVTAVTAIEGLPEDRYRLYLDLILAMLSEPDRRHLEQMGMQSHQYKTEFVRKYVECAERAERAEQALVTSRAEGLRAAVLELARIKLSDLTSEQLAAIQAVGDEAALLALVGALSRAATAADADAVLRAATTAGPG